MSCSENETIWQKREMSEKVQWKAEENRTGTGEQCDLLEPESRRGQQIREGDMSEMESENLVMNVGVKERGCEKERGKDRGFSRPDP